MNLSIAATVMAVGLWTLARLPEISAPGHSTPSTGWEVKYLRPRACPPECPQSVFHVDFDKARNALTLHNAGQGASSEKGLVMTDEQDDDSLYIICWKASARAVFPPNCEYTIDPIRP